MPEPALHALTTFLGYWLAVLGWLSLYGAILLAVALLAERALGHRAQVLVHALWTLVVLRFLLPPGLASRWSVAGFLLHPAHGTAGPARTAVLAHGASVAAGNGAGAFPWWQLALACLWLAGTAVVTASLVRHWRRSRDLLGSGSPWDQGAAREALETGRQRLRIRRPVRVVLTEGTGAPFTMGLLRPVIALPAGAGRWPAPRLQAVLAHELAHIARLDILWLRLENLVQVLFFFHPAAWIAPRRLGRLRELLCDRLALSGRWLDPAVYAESLLDAMRAAPAGGPALRPAGPALAETKEGLTVRLLALKRPPRGVPPRLTITLAGLALLGGLLLPMAPAAAGPRPDAFDDAVRYTRDSGLTEPRRIQAPQPAYPEEARKRGLQGTVVLETLIGTGGAVEDVRVLRPMPGGLTEAAEAAVRRWRFEPARNAKGEAVPVRYVLSVRFLLAGMESEPESTATRRSEGATAPVPVSHPSPVYPEAARRKRVQGAVVLRVDVGVDGSVRQIGVVRGLPEGLTEAAVEAVRHWKFRPAMHAGGRPVAAQVLETVRFRLDHTGTPPETASPGAGR